jgi:ankyrin repeat protein
VLELRTVTRSRWLLLFLGAWLAGSSAMAVADECDFKTAIHNDDLLAIKALLDRGCDPNLATPGGELPLCQVDMKSQRKVTELLLSGGADPRRTGNLPLRLAQSTDTRSMRMLLDHGLPVNYQDENGDTILLSAVSSKYSNTPECNSPGCWHGYTEMVRFLLSRGANPNLRNQYGIAPREKISRLLLSAGADVNAKDFRGRTPLHMLQFRNDVQALTALLLQKGADPAVQDRLGRTALHAVSDTEGQRRDWVEYLMCHGGKPEVRDVLGWTVADLGAIRGWADTSLLHCSEAWQKADKPKSEPERPCLSY